MHRHISERKQEQFYQGQCVFGEERGTAACQAYKFSDNLKKYLPKKVNCMVSSYGYNSFQVGMVIVTEHLNYTTNL